LTFVILPEAYKITG